jgi:hypothetical protein
MLDAVVVGDNEKLLSLTRDRHQRTHNGEYVMWCVVDRFQKLPMLCSGKLSAVQTYINDHAQTMHDHVHLSGLYSSVDRKDGRTGGFYRGRFAVEVVRLDEAAAFVEKMRQGPAVVIASRDCVATVVC